MKKKLMSLLLAGSMIAGLLGGTMTAKAEDNDFTIVTIVKLTGVAWFDRMEEGVRMAEQLIDDGSAYRLMESYILESTQI